MRFHKSQDEDGLDIIEVLIAIVLVLGAIVSLTLLMVKTQISQAENETVDKATLILQDYSEKSRVVPWDRLMSPKSGICTSKGTAGTKIGCYQEPYYYQTYKDGAPEGGYALPLEEKTTVSGTEYTVYSHITKVNSNDKSWDKIISTTGGTGKDRECTTAPLYANGSTSNSDTKPIPCTLKRITIEVVWNNAQGQKRAVTSSWVRAPNPYEEIATSFIGNRS